MAPDENPQHGAAIENGVDLVPVGDDKAVQTKTETKEEHQREGWGSHIEFILSCVGYSVGLGNVWRFPFLAYKNGGGAFLIPYAVSVIIAGLPLYFMELSLGQFTSMGTIGVFRNIAPAFEGIGWGMVVVAVMVALYYNMIIAWVIFYLVHSFRSELIWSHCRNDFNTERCHSNLEEKRCQDLLNDTGAVFFNKTCLTVNETIHNLSAVKVSPSEEFFELFMLQRSPSFEETGVISWKLVLCLAGAWLLVFACLFKGVQSSGKVVYFTAIFPYVVLLILLIRGVTLDGAVDGLLFYVKPNVTQLMDWRVWKDAAEQVFFSLGPAFGSLIAMASYNKFHTNCKRDAIMISCIDSFTSTFAGIAIFSAAGFLAKELNKPISEVTDSGVSLVFVAYPEALVRMPVSPLWSILFFFMLITLGLDSEFAMLETAITAMTDTFPKLRRYKTCVIGCTCIILFLLGLPFCTQAGIYIFTIFNEYSAGYCVVILALAECILVSHVYGIKHFLKDVGMMLGAPPKYYWIATLALCCPIYLLLVFIASLVAFEPSKYGNHTLPNSAQILGVSLSLLSVLCIPVLAGYKVIRCLITKEPLINLVKPTKSWCPAEERNRKRPKIIVATSNIWTTDSTKL